VSLELSARLELSASLELDAEVDAVLGAFLSRIGGPAPIADLGHRESPCCSCCRTSHMVVNSSPKFNSVFLNLIFGIGLVVSFVSILSALTLLGSCCVDWVHDNIFTR